MIKVGNELGTWIKGAEPQTLPRGAALHICGTYSAGSSKENSVVNVDGNLWGYENVWLGGCGVLPRRNASNPTITAVCFALVAVDKMKTYLAATLGT
jgi:choline dehydrogenase-like flavoprotein